MTVKQLLQRLGVLLDDDYRDAKRFDDEDDWDDDEDDDLADLNARRFAPPRQARTSTPPAPAMTRDQEIAALSREIAAERAAMDRDRERAGRPPAMVTVRGDAADPTAELLRRDRVDALKYALRLSGKTLPDGALTGHDAEVRAEIRKFLGPANCRK